MRAVALDDLADRPATKLSGGQQQRLALARALVMEPQLLLLDEPLSNLDAKLRERMRFELKRIQRELGLTTVYVTHDQSEALALSHLIAVMNEGRIVQIGSPRDIYERPATASSPISSARRTSSMQPWLPRRPRGAPGSTRRSGELNVQCVDRLRRTTRSWSRCARRTSNCRSSRRTRTPTETISAPAAVEAKAFLGDCLDFRVKIGDFVVLARAHPSLRTPVGDTIYVRMRAEKCVAVPDQHPRGETPDPATA